MKINEGMYVRTEKGKISKIKWITAQKWEGLENTVEASFMLENNESFEYPRDNFKASNYIIDLIEEGDYVNGQLVYYDEESECLGQNFVDADSNYYFESITKGGDYKIKTILTKEQYENNCYKVEE